MIISAPQLLIDGAFSGPGAVVIENGIITAILPGLPENPDIRLDHGYLSPGLIDLHNNGAFGIDFSTASGADWDHVISRLAEHGVTSLAPTMITAPLEILHMAASRLADAARAHPGILGLHLEGPFLSPQKHGVHQPAWLQVFAPETILALLAIPDLRIVTLAPEIPGALAAIRQLTAAGITVALGHTAATADETFAAAAAGARLVTHVFTAQSPLHHRAPGAAGAALTDDRLYPCVIADGIHMDPVILKLVFAASPNAIAVTDSLSAAGMPDGFEGEFGGARIILKNGVAQRPDGTFAGAAITLDQGIRRLIAAGIKPETALAAATERPATALGLTDRGRIAPGQRADLVWWNDDFTVAQVWRAGRTEAAPKPAITGTEYARPDLHDLDERPTLNIVNAFLGQEAAAQRALASAAPQLAALTDAIAKKLQTGGRLFYAGAGTSDRLALLDAVECDPTFGVGPETIISLLAGGPNAFLNAVEGAEDDTDAAIDALTSHNFSANDALVGIAASGRTPFTLSAITHANTLGALTGVIVNNLDSPLAKAAGIAIEINSGPEIIAGSTRLSAGTAQKIALNILSSTVMIRLGKTHGPYMVDVRATNDKLKTRATRITATLANVSEAEAQTALAVANMHVKTAILLLRRGTTAKEATKILTAAGGSLRKALIIIFCVFWAVLSLSVTQAETVSKQQVSKELVLTTVTQLAEHRELRDVDFVSKLLGEEFIPSLATSELKTNLQNGVSAVELSPKAPLWNDRNVILTYELEIQSTPAEIASEIAVEKSTLISMMDFDFLSVDYCLTDAEISKALGVHAQIAQGTDGSGGAGYYDLPPKNGIYSTVMVNFDGLKDHACAGGIIIYEKSK